MAAAWREQLGAGEAGAGRLARGRAAQVGQVAWGVGSEGMRRGWAAVAMVHCGNVSRVGVAVESLKPHAHPAGQLAETIHLQPAAQARVRQKALRDCQSRRAFLPSVQRQQDQKYKALIYLRVNSGCTVSST